MYGAQDYSHEEAQKEHAMTHASAVNSYIVPAVSFRPGHTGHTAAADELGMRPMQARAWAKRGEQYLLIKSPPASGKSRALMFIALDKLYNQGMKQAIIVVPERSIGGSFADEPLTQFGFYWDWTVAPQWNLCNVSGIDQSSVARSKAGAVQAFLGSEDRVLVCTHATFRFAVDALGIEAFDNRLIAVDEFHHVSSNPDNKLGSQLSAFIARDEVHLVAMTGSYFRGDSEAVLSPTEEARFETVTYTYYEQLNGYRWLKSLDIGYFFYTGRYVDAVEKVLDPRFKTIVHIPSVNSRESLQDKEREVSEIMGALGEWKGIDPSTDFHVVLTPDGRMLRIADLVDDSDPARRSRVLTALKNPAHKNNRDHVDIIIALGMAKEGFDWIWCEHALTIGYRSSLTEIVQIIGRATRDAEGKVRARFTNLIAEPTAEQSAVAEAVNDMLKAISASLLMEQVLAPRYEFTPKNAGPQEGFDYGQQGYDPGGTNVGVSTETGAVHLEISGLKTPTSPEAARICREDLNEVITGFLQDKVALERGTLDTENLIPEEITVQRMGKIVRERYPELSEEDQEAVRQHAVAVLNITQQAKLALPEVPATEATPDAAQEVDPDAGTEAKGNTSFIDGVRKFINVRDLDIDLIDRINPFEAAYSVLAKTMDEKALRQIQASIAAKRVAISEDEARELARRALQFKIERGRAPEITSADAWEKMMAQGVVALKRYRDQARAREAALNG